LASSSSYFYYKAYYGAYSKYLRISSVKIPSPIDVKKLIENLEFSALSLLKIPSRQLASSPFVVSKT
jgi:hypothetical protein